MQPDLQVAEPTSVRLGKVLTPVAAAGLLALRGCGEGYQLERQANYAVALKLDLDKELLFEGAAREVVHAIQIARRSAGLQVEDRIDLTLFGDEELLEAIRAHADYVTGETLAATLSLDGAQPKDAHVETTLIDGRKLGIALRRAG